MASFTRSSYWHKFNGLSRYFVAHILSSFIPYIILNEYPRSGGSWICTMLSECLMIPFPRNRLPMLNRCILHGHKLHSWNLDNVIIIWRDGRDILISQYYHYLFENDRGNSLLVKNTRSDLNFKDYNDIQSNLEQFIDYMYKQPRHPRFTWRDFVFKWAEFDKGVHVKYEDMLQDPIYELDKLLYTLTGKMYDKTMIAEVIKNHSFENITGRKKGDEVVNSFARKGVSGDWKKYFDNKARIKFNEYAGDALIKLGYEKNDSWT